MQRTSLIGDAQPQPQIGPLASRKRLGAIPDRAMVKDSGSEQSPILERIRLLLKQSCRVDPKRSAT